jgi:mono/diheme cytochrome c family protein
VNRFAVSMTLFMIVFGFGAFTAYRSASDTYAKNVEETKLLKEEAKVKAEESAKEAEKAKAEAAKAAGEKPAATDVMVKADLKKGEATYSANCQGCHAAKAAGGVGPKLAGSEVKDWALAEFKTALLEGKTPTRALASMMPKFNTGFGGAGKPPTDQELTDLHGYLKSL